MEREADVNNFAVCLGFLEEFNGAKILHFLPVLRLQPMQKIVIYVISLEFLQLSIKHLLHVFRFTQHKGRKFGGNSNFAPVTITQRFTENFFALTPMIGRRRIDIVYTCLLYTSDA